MNSMNSMNNIYILKKSNLKDKKFMIITPQDKITGRTKTIHFGASGMSDYTIHKDPERMERYTIRHQKRENWLKTGIKTAGFWAKHILWNKPSLVASIRDTEKRFRIKVKYIKSP